MKKIVAIILTGCLLVSVTACGGGGAASKGSESAAPAQESQTADAQEMSTSTETTVAETENVQESTAESTAPEDVDNTAWDTLESMGNIETVNGFLTVSITMPKDFVGEDITQEALDEKAGERYVSARLNEDGSVTYKLTKKQHKDMMGEIVAGIDESLQGMVDGTDYSFTEIKHNDDYTIFDVTAGGDELGLTDSFATLAFYMYGGMYGIFTGKTPEKVIVNFYNPNGDLISTADSSNMGS
jgi:hypothetical protein